MEKRWCVAPVTSRVKRCASSTRVRASAVATMVLSMACFTQPATVWKVGGIDGSGYKNVSGEDDYGDSKDVKNMKALIERATKRNAQKVAEARSMFRLPAETDVAPPKTAIVGNKTHPPMYIRAIDNKDRLDTGRSDLVEHRQWRTRESKALEAFQSHSIYKAKQRRSKRFKASIVHHGDQDKRLRLCPENSHDATHAECMCRPGHFCVGNKCYVTNRGTAFRIIGRHACHDCRCDPAPCVRHRQECSKLQTYPPHVPRHTHNNPELMLMLFVVLLSFSLPFSIPAEDKCQSMALTHLIPRLPSGRSHLTSLGLPRVMCIMFVIEDNRYDAHRMRKSWANDCDEFLLMDRNVESGLVPSSKRKAFDNVFLTEPPEAYGEGRIQLPKWNSTLAMWRHVRHRYTDRADWFLFVNDRTYVRMLQLKQLVAAKSQAQPNSPLFIGRRMRHQSGLVINAWNAGSLLNTMALTDLLKSVDGIGLADIQMFRPLEVIHDLKSHDIDDDDADVVEVVSGTPRQRWEHASAAIALPPELVCNRNASIDGGDGITSTLTRMSACLAARGIKPTDTQDFYGMERFHVTNPENLPDLPAWDDLHAGALKSRTAPFPFPAGIQGVSKESVTFSLCSAHLAEAFHSFLRKTCYAIESNLRYNDGWNETKFQFEEGEPLSQKGLKKIFP